MNKSTKRFLEITKRIEAIAHTGLSYTDGEYDRERYRELTSISHEMIQLLSGESIDKVSELFSEVPDGYKTPKVDIRSVIFNAEGKILLVQERSCRRWALPGGWADIGLSPAEVAAKEVLEEAGITVEVTKLAAIMDKRNHPHPPEPWYCYKLFFLCKPLKGIPGGESLETLNAQYFDSTELPELSESRNTHQQVISMFRFFNNPDLPTIYE